ncbi:Thymidylate kinase [Lonepinella sp. MS14434]
MKKGKFIVITGLDGAGTTSLGEYLSKSDPNGYFIHTPNGIYSDVRELFTKYVREKSPAGHFNFYLSSVISASYEIEKMLETHNVYCVRYLIDTVVSHRVAGLDVKLEYDLGYYKIVEPDLTLFVDIEESIRQSRISSRGKSELDKVLDDSNVKNKFLQEFYQLSNCFVKVNNNSSFDEMCKNVKRIVSEYIS